MGKQQTRSRRRKDQQSQRQGRRNHPIREAKRKMKKIEDSIRDLWNTNKQTNIHIIGVLKEEKERGAKKLIQRNNG